MRHPWKFALSLGLLVALVSGCGPRPTARTEPGPAAKPSSAPKTPGESAGETERAATPPPMVAPGGAAARPGYERRTEPLKGVDASSLAGRRIVLDPGHGGRFPGSIGSQGLTEAEVNLGVALHLWGLLTDAGAEVRMTRTADTDFTSPTDSSLRADLAARVVVANAFKPDVFLSIHHNADASGRHDLNETQTYYKFSDPDASLDLGEALHRHLVVNLGIGADRLLPGNYFVLRNATGAAVLGESSYLTNPFVEARLALAAKQRIEAEAYFLGLIDYFRRGVPRIVATQVNPALGGNDPVDGSERPWLVAVTDREPGSARLTVDGIPADTARFEKLPGAGTGAATWQMRWRPLEPLTDGLHRVEWAVRAKGGNWSQVRQDSFNVDLPIAKTVLEVAPRAGLASGQVASLTLRALDRHGRAVSDTVVARFGVQVGAAIVDSLAPRAVTRGEARAYARATGGSAASFTATMVRPRVRPELAQLEARATLAAPGGAGEQATTGFARTADGRPIAGALVRGAAVDTLGVRTNADGFFALPLAASSPFAEAPGYVTAVASVPANAAVLRLVPIGGGALLGRKIALDPGGGGVDSLEVALAGPVAGALDPGTPQAPAAGDSTVLDTTLTAPYAGAAPGDTLAARRAQWLEADANLRVARALREYLEAAGASVVLTRDRPESLTAIDRLRRTEAFAPERVVTIAHRARAGSASAGHYFSSAPGKALARRIVARLDGRGVTKGARVVESASYLVQQTAAIAVAVNAPDAQPLYADSTRGAGRLREEAYAIYLALLEDLGGDPKAFTPLAVQVRRAGAPLPGVPVELDGRWILITDAKGDARFDGLPGGAAVSVAAGSTVGTAQAPRAVRATLPATAPITLDIP